MRYLIMSLIPILLIACNTPNTFEELEDTDSLNTLKNFDTSSAATSDSTIDRSCYRYVSGKDVYTFTLLRDGKNITGTAHYNNFEKDDSWGAVSGTMENDIIHLWYNYQAEGISSVSERFFKLSEEGMTEGIGEVAVKKDTTYFKNPATIDYTKGLVYKK